MSGIARRIGRAQQQPMFVAEDRLGLEERDTVFPDVPDSLGRIPFESEFA
jgi:hypothetical protein